MTDLLLNNNHDLQIENGDVVIISNLSQLVRQKLLIRLRAFTNTLFTDINYGIDVTLVFAKGTKDLLDQHLRELITNEQGVVELVTFESSVDQSRNYHCEFIARVADGEIVGIRGLVVGSTGMTKVSGGIWLNGYWDSSGNWDNEEIWGSD